MTSIPTASAVPRNNSRQDVALLLGRLLIAALFLPAGLSKIPGFTATVNEIAMHGLPLPALGAAIAIVVEVAAGLALVLGWRTRVAAHALLVFTVVATVLFHGFWGVADAQKQAEIIAFSQNLGIIGGLLLLGVTGAGRFGLDSRRR